MKFDSDTLNEVIVTLTRNKSRSLLTSFGVFWGILMLVILMGGGKGLKRLMSENFEGFATNSGFTYAGRTSEPYKGFRKGRYWDVDMDDYYRLQNMVAGIDVVSACSATWNCVVNFRGKRYDEGCIKGLLPNYEYIEHYDMMYGRFLNEIDEAESRKVCILGKGVYDSLFGKGEDPCGMQIDVNGIFYKIIGVCRHESNINVQGNASQAISIPLSTFRQVFNTGKRLDILCYTAKAGVRVSEIEPRIKELVSQAHFIHPDDAKAVQQLNAEEMFSMVDNLFIGINILIMLVGIGTLLAGIIGVSNIMMVTVKERTVEIGIRRAIGALPGDIMGQILAESLLLTLVAGMAGITVGVSILQVMDTVILNDAGMPYGYQVSFGMAIGAGAILLALGVVAGLAPAYRAMAIKPVEAMREE